MRRPGWCSAFMVYLRESRGNIAVASDRVPVNRKTVYERMWSDESFRVEVYSVVGSFPVPKEKRPARENPVVAAAS